MPIDKVSLGKSRFEDDNFRDLYMSKVEAPFLGELFIPFAKNDISAEVSAWYEEGKRLADALKKCEQTCEVHDMLDVISDGVDIYGDK